VACEYVTLCDKRDLTDVMKVGDLGMLAWNPAGSTKVLLREQRARVRGDKGDLKPESE
jgi:hypothetical protein